MKPQEQIEELLLSKSFDALTPDEKVLVLRELGSVSEYEAMRKIALSSGRSENLTPDPRILKTLQHTMREKQPQSMPLFTFRVPAYATAIMILIAIGTTWLLTRSSTLPPVRVTEIQHDTVYLASKPDTVYVDRVVYRTARMKKYFPENLTTRSSAPAREPSVETIGVSMKEQEELERLLVSGSR
jgi:hypothetical protein